MKTFLNDLKKEANRYLEKNETNELVSYYEEIINERLSNNETIESILASYDIEVIVKEALPGVILKRKDKVFKNSFQVMLLLLSSPILIPLAIVYIALVVVIIALFISFILVSAGGILFLVPYLIETFNYITSFGQWLGLTSLGLLISIIVFYIGYLFVNVFYKILKGNIKLFLKIFIKRRDQHEAK